MFDRIVFRDIPRRAARRGLYALLASFLQGAVLGSALLASAQAGPRETDELPTIQVRFVSGLHGKAAPHRWAPRAARPPGATARGGGGSAAAAKAVKPPPPAALVQPHEVASRIRMPGPGEPGEALPEGEWGDDDEGVVGGYAGPAEFQEESVPPPAEAIEEAAQWFTAGFRRPVEEQAGCIASAIRLPSELAGFVSGRITVKFAVGRDGTVDRVVLLSEVPDRRIELAIASALRSCRWRPGADARGEAVALWVIMPLRFEGG